MTTHRDNHTIVIGAGLAGLATAATLARSGQPVTVLERGESTVGGRAKTTEHNGFRLNEGPHAMYCAGRAMRELRALGVDPSGAAPMLDRAGVWHRGHVRRLPVSPGALIATRLLSVRSKFLAAHVLSLMRRGHDRRAVGLTLREWFDRRRVPGDLRGMIEMYIRLATYCNAPETLAAPVALSQFKLSLDGVLYLHDGWSRLVDDLCQVVTSRGGAIVRTGSVAHIERSSAAWSATTTEGDIHHGSNVVLAVGGPAAAAAIAGEDPGWVEQAGPPCLVATLDLGVDREPVTPVLLATGEPLYGSSHAPPARLAPAGLGLVGIMRYLTADEARRKAPERHELRAELDAHSQRMGVSPEHIVHERYLHRMTASHATVRADCPRPRGDELAARRLWCAGDWIGPIESGDPAPLLADPAPILADAAVGSGVDAARAIIALA
jgi:phytoene dehydrogenase-like protein